MTHKHNHTEPCKHALAFCGKCQLPYCTDCGKEWAEPCLRNHYNWTWTNPVYPQWFTSGGSFTVPTTAANASVYNHVHFPAA